MGASPWPSSVEESLRGGYECVVTAKALTSIGTVVLELEDYDVDITERRSPRWVARLRVKLPEAQATLDALDPRRLVRVLLTVSYRLANGQMSPLQVANLHLRERTVDRPSNVMSLACTSDEALAIDFQMPNPNTDGTLQYASFDAATFIRLGIEALLNPPYLPTWDIKVPPRTVTASYSLPIFDASIDVADTLNADLFDDGDRVWRLWPRPTTAGRVVASLSTGPNGVLTDTSSNVSRDDWANCVALIYTNRTAAGLTETVRSFVQVTSGPLNPNLAGYKVYSEEREGKPTQAQADAAGRALLRRFLSRSRSLTLVSPPMWWLRPGDTVTVDLPMGPQELHLVVSVRFTPQGMTTVTRLPDEFTTITGE